MIKKIVFTSICLIIVFSLLLSGCAQSSAPVEPKTEAEQPQAEEPSDKPVTLRVWTHQNDAFNEGYQMIADAYMAENPNVTINFETFDYDTYIQTLQTSLPAGTEADILQMFGSWVCSYASGGNLAETPPSVFSLEQAMSDVYSAQIAGYICEEKLFGVPQEFNIEYGAALVNTRLAEKAGISDISSGWADWDAFIADAKKLAVTQDGVMTRSGYNYTGSDGTAATFYSLILQYGGQYLTDDGFKVNTSEGKKALELMKRFVDEGLNDPLLFNDEQNWVGDSFFEETSAIGLVGPWVIPEYSTDFKDVLEHTQYINLPSISTDPVFIASSGWGLTVSANSPNQEVAWDFVSFATLNSAQSIKWNLASGTLPALKANATGASKEQLIAEFPYFEPFLNILEFGAHEGQFPDRDLVWYEITYPRILDFLQGNTSLDETLETIEREVSETF